MKKRTVLLLYLLCIMVISLNASITFPYSVTLTWDAPSKNADGTPLTDLAGYYVYRGTQSRNYDSKVRVGNVTTYTISNLTTAATYYLAVTAYDTSGNESTCSNEVNMTQYTLMVNKSGTGSGKTTSVPVGITCGTDCQETYDASSVVTLTATPEEGSVFTGWSGGGCSGTGQCVLVISAPTTVTANFSALTSFSSETIIDNRDPDTSRTGTWWKSSGTGQIGVDSVFSRNGSTFTWHFTPSQSGNYEVSMWWTYRDSRSTSVPIDIEYSSGKSRVYVNQRKNGGQWNYLGKFYFKEGSSYDVTIISQPHPTSTCADAVRFKLIQ